MRILFLTHYFPPEVNAPAVRTFEHCKRWVAEGHDVHVVTCVPSHPKGVPFPGHRAGWYARESVDGIVVHRVWTYLAANSGVAKRVANYLSFVPSAVWRALRLGRFDVVVATSPQFFCAVAGAAAARLKGAPWVMEVRDLWPESIPAVGAMKPSRTLRVLEGVARWLYRDAAAVVCVTQSFVAAIARLGIDERKLAFVPNGIDASFWQTNARDAERQALGFAQDDVVASFVGTLGMAHGLGTVLDAASALRERQPRIKFLLVGDGADAKALDDRIARERLSNVVVTGLVARERVPGLLAASDLALVTLKASPVFRTVLPSKMFEAMVAEKPIVLAVDGEARAVLERAGAGVFVEPGDASALRLAIEDLALDADRRRQMGGAGHAFVTTAFTRDHWASVMLGALERVAQPETSTIHATVRS